MKPNKTESTTLNGLAPLQVKQAIVALELGSTDTSIMKYLEFLTKQIPTSALYFLHVLPEISLYNTLYEEETRTLLGEEYELDDDIINRMELAIEGKLSKEKDMYMEYYVREGDPLEELLDSAQELSADLLVIGQKTNAGSHGILAKKLARQARCNALVIPDHAKQSLRSILVPVDYSPNSGKALQLAVSLNKQLEKPAELVAVNIYEMPNLSIYKVGRSHDQLKQMLEEDRRDAMTAFLERFVPEAKDNIRIELIEKDAPGIANYLMDFAKDNDTDFIVMGARGHSRVERMLMGSVTEKVLSLNKDIATLVVKD